MKNKVYIDIAADCGYRMLDGQRLKKYFLKNNYRIVDHPKNADYIIFITCGISNEMAFNAIDSINEFKKLDAELIVAGCLPAIRPDLISKNFDGKIIKTRDLIDNTEKIDTFFPDIKIKFCDIKDPSIIESDIEKGNCFEQLKKKTNILKNKRLSFSIRLQYFISEIIPFKIRRYILKKFLGEDSVIFQYYSGLINHSEYCIRVGWGCKGNCSYCGIKKAIGPLKSKPVEEIILDFKRGLDLGYKYFFISSPDLGSYGLDIGSNLPKLLDEIIKIKGDYKIFLGGLNPVWAVKYADSLEQILKKGKIDKMECPIQSGSSRILKLMKRYSNIDEIKETYLKFKKANPSLLFYPHIMFGFPSETINDIKETLSFIKTIGFNSGKLYRCSCIPGTEAEKIEPKISEELMLKRKKIIKDFFKKNDYRLIWPRLFGFFMKKD